VTRACALAAVVAVSVALWLVTKLASAAAPGTGYQLIVHPTNPVVTLDRAFIAQGFLKKITSWGHGGVIRPADLTRDSPVRRRFSEEALGRSVAAVKSYWQQMIFSGRGVPPPELPSEDDVIRYVLREPGAIGYVSAGIDLKGARAVEVR
jgi:ABC-type phosphate transport system substrate-binding protein